MIRLVRQRRTNDCMVSCIAMYCGVRYTELLERHATLRCADEEDRGLSVSALIRIVKEEGCPSFEIRTFSPGLTKAIVRAPSLNHPGGHHAVLWDGDTIKDPSNLERYTSKSLRSPISAIVPVDDEIGLALGRSELKTLLNYVL